jgi:MFS family permease
MVALATVTSLLLSTALLLVGHGLMLTLLPLRGGSIGMSEFLIGLSASSYFLGFVMGCLGIPRLIARVGHIRGFAVLTAVMISAALCLEMLDQWQAWLLLRFLIGAAISGLYAVIESWLNSQSTPESRGRILAVYTFITLTAMLAGQFLINVGPVDTPAPFIVAAVFLAMAILPVGLTRRIAPEPIESTRVGLKRLFSLSHSAFAGGLLSGLVVGSFWSLGAIFANHYGRSQMDVTWFMSAAIAGGALLQYPIGWLSDRVDRRRVLVLLCNGGAVTAAAVAASAGLEWHLAAVFLFGASVMPLYAISLATAADVSPADEFVQIGTSVLLLNAIGAVLAPLPLGQIMAVFGPTGLFWSFTALCLAFAVYIAVQSRSPRTVEVEHQTPFTAAASETAPAGFALDPRGEAPKGQGD